MFLCVDKIDIKKIYMISTAKIKDNIICISISKLTDKVTKYQLKGCPCRY